MSLHASAFVICFIGLIVLSSQEEPGALSQLVGFLFCIAVAVAVVVGSIYLFCGLLHFLRKA